MRFTVKQDANGQNSAPRFTFPTEPAATLFEVEFSVSRYNEPPYQRLYLNVADPAKLPPLPTHPGDLKALAEGECLVCVETRPNAGRICRLSPRMGLSFLTTDHHDQPQWDFGNKVWEIVINDMGQFEQEMKKCLQL